jgi:FKBP-type peptidyl-prolyl cis-trans isomerase
VLILKSVMEMPPQVSAASFSLSKSYLSKIGLELSLRHSRVGEKLRAKCSWKFGFGMTGRPATVNGAIAIPPQSNLEFDVEIIEVFLT